MKYWVLEHFNTKYVETGGGGGGGELGWELPNTLNE